MDYGIKNGNEKFGTVKLSDMPKIIEYANTPIYGNYHKSGCAFVFGRLFCRMHGKTDYLIFISPPLRSDRHMRFSKG